MTDGHWVPDVDERITHLELYTVDQAEGEEIVQRIAALEERMEKLIFYIARSKSHIDLNVDVGGMIEETEYRISG